ncbi:sec-independent protein translocase protein TatA [Sinobacterium caligoides]|uniref:Sec-independent protein translocase protein TatA n=1 Tax=Sinobacterium caligoides TaxID=933926 RepID=A0A3N2DDY8_9GAMM|nr:Sec-independent protein translocase subunit TatA [Sinobacterium caligoides]ROR97942.1 sec-independent protein translocase protein TatA [Sinobacterium caligoides]
MGLGGISIWQLLIILAIVIVLFGTKRLKNIGGDLGGAIKGFKKAMNDEEKTEQEKKNLDQQASPEGESVANKEGASADPKKGE